MELTNHQLQALNAKLPVGFRIEIIQRKEARPVREADNLDMDIQYPPMNAVKRPTREKPITTYEEPEQKQGEGYRKLLRILQTLKKNPSATPFLEPVDPRQVPDYYDVIKDPMDLSTAEMKLRRGDYESAYHFAMDLRMVWNNSFYYNAKTPDLYHMTMEMAVLFEQLMRGNENLILGDRKDVVQDLCRQVEKLSKGIKNMQSKPPKPTPQPQPPQVERPMTIQDKKNLCNNIKKLDPRYLSGLLEIVRENTNVQGEELEFDVEKLPSRVCRELERYVRQSLQNASRSKKKKVVEEPKRDVNLNKLRELDKELSELPKQLKVDHHNPSPPPRVEDDDMSSSSDSEDFDDIPEPQDMPKANFNTDGISHVESLYDTFKQTQINDIDSDPDLCSFGFGGTIDIDRQDDIFG